MEEPHVVEPISRLPMDGKQDPPIHNICNECDADANQDFPEILETLASHWRKV